MTLFRVRRHRPLPKTLINVFAELVSRVDKELAICPLTPAAVHEARKSVKRLRALVSLVALDLDRNRARFDRVLRDVNRTLSATRDATVAITTFENLATAANEALINDFAVARAALDRRLAGVHDREINVDREVVRPLKDLLQRWKRRTWGRDEWALLEPNLRRTYRRGRRMNREIAAGAPTERLHELRKLVKQTQYHFEFLIPIAPMRMQTEHDDWERLADTLGQHHDLWVLQDLLRTTPSKELSRSARTLVLGQVCSAARVLEHHAARWSPILYAERARAFTDRLGTYWQLWQEFAGQ